MKPATLPTSIGTVLVLLFALWSSARWLDKAVHVRNKLRMGDEVSDYERRLAPLRARLPPDAVIGYLSDPEPAGVSMAEGRLHYKKYILTKYALVPILVVRNQQPPLIVGNFDDAASARQAAALRLEQIEDFGDGIVLFRRRTE